MNDGLMLGGGHDPRLENGDPVEYIAQDDSGRPLGVVQGFSTSEFQFRVTHLSFEEKDSLSSTVEALILGISEIAKSLGCQVLWSRVEKDELPVFLSQGFVQVTPLREEVRTSHCFVLKSLRGFSEVCLEASEVRLERQRVFQSAPEKSEGESLWSRAEKFSRLFQSRNSRPRT